MSYLVINIGCIECGVSSQVAGLFETKEEAEEVRDALDANYSWREGGQNVFKIFPLPIVGNVNAEYTMEAQR